MGMLVSGGLLIVQEDFWGNRNLGKNDSSGKKAFPHLLIFQVPLTSHFVPQKDNPLPVCRGGILM